MDASMNRYRLTSHQAAFARIMWPPLREWLIQATDNWLDFLEREYMMRRVFKLSRPHILAYQAFATAIGIQPVRDSVVTAINRIFRFQGAYLFTVDDDERRWDQLMMEDEDGPRPRQGPLRERKEIEG